MSTTDKFRFFRTGSTTWATPTTHRGYTALITYLSGTGYTLAITGSGAPSNATYPTLRNAKNAFRKFLHNKPIDIAP